MKIELRQLSNKDGRDFYEMIQEIGPGENGFTNGMFGKTYDEFTIKLDRYLEISKGINLNPDHVPQTLYWLIVNDKVVGYGKLRDYLNDNLLRIGGHIGYTIRPTERGKGYGKILLKELLKQAKLKEIEAVLLTCNEDNIGSRRVIEANYGVIEGVSEGRCRYWVKMN